MGQGAYGPGGPIGHGVYGQGEPFGQGGLWARGSIGHGGISAKGACRPGEGDGDGRTYLRTDVLSTPYGEEVSVPSQGRCLKGNRSQVVSTRERVLMKKRKGIGAR